jgi:hypothetical protein
VAASLVHWRAGHQAELEILPILMGADLAQPLEGQGLAARALPPMARHWSLVVFMDYAKNPPPSPHPTDFSFMKRGQI